MFYIGLGGRKKKAGMRRSSSLDMLAVPMSSGMGGRTASYNMLSNIATIVMSVSVPGHEHPFAIQAQHNRQVEGYVGDQKPAQMEFYLKRKTPMAPGKEGDGGEGGEGGRGIEGKIDML